MQIRTKLVMCSYNIPIVEIKKTFDCSCKKPHKTFAYSCARHPYGHSLPCERCQCINRAYAKCPFCCFVICCLNIQAYKVCLEEMPDFMSYRVVPIEKHLETLQTDLFIWFDVDFVRITLDNPMHIVPAETD